MHRPGIEPQISRGIGKLCATPPYGAMINIFYNETNNGILTKSHHSDSALLKHPGGGEDAVKKGLAGLAGTPWRGVLD